MNDYYKVNIEKSTIANKNYRKVLYTTEQTQLVLMSLLPSEDIPLEKHENITQFIRIEQGTCVCYIGNDIENDLKKMKQTRLKDNDIIIIPANTYHYIKATSELKLYTLYSFLDRPEHSKNLVQKRQPISMD